MAMEVTKPDIWALLSETKRILMAHRHHFLTLSIIFLLPISCFILLYPLLYSKLVNFIYSPSQPIQPYTLFLTFLCSLSLTLFSFCGVSSITYSAFHAFYDKPLDLISSIKSIFTSFFPLLATTIVMQLIFFLISLSFSLLLFLLFIGTHQLLGIKLSLYFFAFCAFLVLLTVVLVTIHLQIKWSLVAVVAVMEKCWGLEPLRRSSNLIKGMKRVALSLMLFFGIFGGLFVCFNVIQSYEIPKGSPIGIVIIFDWVKLLLVFAWRSLFLMLLLLYNIVAHTVFYISCKAIYDEHAEKSGNGDYSKLPFDDGNV